MKKLSKISVVISAVLAIVIMSVPTLAASNPADDVSAYSYKTGQQSYETRMSETPEWFDNKDEVETADYSFNTGNQNAQARKNAFAGMPAGDDLSDEELNEFFSSNGLGIGSAYENGEYNESAKASYGYNKGQAAYQERHASFAGNN